MPIARPAINIALRPAGGVRSVSAVVSLKLYSRSLIVGAPPLHITSRHPAESRSLAAHAGEVRRWRRLFGGRRPLRGRDREASCALRDNRLRRKDAYIFHCRRQSFHLQGEAEWPDPQPSDTGSNARRRLVCLML